MKSETQQKIEQYEDAAIAGIMATATIYQPTSLKFTEAVTDFVVRLSQHIAHTLNQEYAQERMQQTQASQQAVDEYVRVLLLRGKHAHLYMPPDGGGHE